MKTGTHRPPSTLYTCCTAPGCMHDAGAVYVIEGKRIALCDPCALAQDVTEQAVGDLLTSRDP